MAGKKRFKFRFEAVERVRRSQEDEALRLLAQAQRVFQAALDHKAGLLERLRLSLERRETLGEAGKEAVPATPFRLENAFIAGTKQRIIQADQAILRARRGVEKALRGFLHARRQTRIVESIREKDFAEYRKALQQREQKELDDLYVMRARMSRDSDFGEGVA